MESTVYRQIEPGASGLRKFIKLYYVHHSDDPNYAQKITYFPNYNITLNVYQHSEVTWDLYTRYHKYSKSPEYLKLLVTKFDRSRVIVTKGPFSKLTIVF